MPGSFGTLVQRGRALAAVVLLAVGCGGAGYGPVAQCRASQLHGPLDALGPPGLDCSAVEGDFGVVHDLAIFFGAGSQQQIELILSGFSYRVATTAGQNYAGEACSISTPTAPTSRSGCSRSSPTRAAGGRPTIPTARRPRLETTCAT